MKKEKNEKTEKKVKTKIDKRKIIEKMIASIMLIILLAGSFYSLIYILINGI